MLVPLPIHPTSSIGTYPYISVHTTQHNTILYTVHTYLCVRYGHGSATYPYAPYTHGHSRYAQVPTITLYGSVHTYLDLLIN